MALDKVKNVWKVRPFPHRLARFIVPPWYVLCPKLERKLIAPNLGNGIDGQYVTGPKHDTVTHQLLETSRLKLYAVRAWLQRRHAVESLRISPRHKCEVCLHVSYCDGDLRHNRPGGVCHGAGDCGCADLTRGRNGSVNQDTGKAQERRKTHLSFFPKCVAQAARMLPLRAMSP